MRALALALVVLATPALADAPAVAPLATTEHLLALPEGELAYTATAGHLTLEDARGHTAGRVFVVAYEGEGDGRPVTFAFNGGPGAASAYLHLGALGPAALATDDEGTPRHPPATEPNPGSWLAFTDLVFIDPIGTGFSRPDPELENARDRFWTVEGDLDSIAEVIRLWLDRHGRWGDPLYLAGESYGGYRAAVLAARLPRRHGIAVTGAVLISPVLDFQTIRGGALDPLPWIGLLPSLVASARDLGVARPPERAEVEAFALGDYARALLEPERLDEVLPVLAEWTGIEEPLWRARRGRIGASEFRRLLLRDQDRLLSAYDGAVAAADPDPVAPFQGFDPLLDGLTAPFTTAYLRYLADALEVDAPTDFRLLSREVHRAWRWPRRQGFLSAVGELQEALSLLPSLRVLVVHGETDLVTPYFASEWVLRQIRANVAPADGALASALLPGGHMMYLREDARAALAEAAREIYPVRR
jgi:carboxypeptidase C (cathepsin A)